MVNTNHKLTLSRIERKLLNIIKENNLEYDDFELNEIAHVELKNFLLEKVKEIKTRQNKTNLHNVGVA